MAELRLVLVTPEKTLVDRPVSSIRVPMHDGSAGVYPGRAAMVGRLGCGELRLVSADGSHESYFIDGGFLQIKAAQVSVLTNAARSVKTISRAAALAELDAVRGQTPDATEDSATRSRKLERARKLVSLATVD